MMFRYQFSGVRFESALPIPEWDALAIGDAAPADVRITLNAPAEIPEGRHGAQVAHPGDYDLAIPRIGQYRVLDGDRIAVTPAPGAPDDEVRLFLLGSALSALFTQRGLLLLHASVVAWPDRTVAIAGPSGSGKSTLAAALVRRGGTFVCDDLGRFDAGATGTTVYPSTPRMKLSPETLAALDWPTDDLPRVHARAVKFSVPQTHDVPDAPRRLDAFFVLGWTEGPIHSERLSGLDAIRALVNSATYRPRSLAPLGRLADHWRQCTLLATTVPIVRLERPRGWHALDDTVAIIRSGALTPPR